MRTKAPEERKAEMVAIAAVLFSKQGFIKTHISEITDAAKVAKGLFYYYFATKDDMVKTVVEGYSSYLGAWAERIAEGPGTGREKLARLFTGEEWRKYFTTPLMADLRLPESFSVYSDMCERLTTHLLPAVTRMVGDLAASGKKPELAEHAAAVFLYGILMRMRQSDLSQETVLEMADLMLS